jgi:low affinity Fe/Cu permease
MAYVTTERIIVNKSKGQFSLKAHFLTVFLVLFAPLVPGTVAIAIVVAIVAIVAVVLVRKRRSRKQWPTMKDVEEGVRRFEVRKNQVISIELKQPTRLRRSFVRITSLSNDVFHMRIAGKKVFRVANNLMMRFEPNRVKSTDK